MARSGNAPEFQELRKAIGDFDIQKTEALLKKGVHPKDCWDRDFFSGVLNDVFKREHLPMFMLLTRHDIDFRSSIKYYESFAYDRHQMMKRDQKIFEATEEIRALREELTELRRVVDEMNTPGVVRLSKTQPQKASG